MGCINNRGPLRRKQKSSRWLLNEASPNSLCGEVGDVGVVGVTVNGQTPLPLNSAGGSGVEELIP